jgi:hypothetical protein
MVLFIDTSDRYPDIARESDGRELPASEHGPDFRLRLNDELIHGRCVRPPLDDLDAPRYSASQIRALRTGVLPASQAGVDALGESAPHSSRPPGRGEGASRDAH